VLDHFHDEAVRMQTIGSARLNDAHAAAEHVTLAEGFAASVDSLEKTRVFDGGEEDLLAVAESPLVPSMNVTDATSKTISCSWSTSVSSSSPSGRSYAGSSASSMTSSSRSSASGRVVNFTTVTPSRTSGATTCFAFRARRKNGRRRLGRFGEISIRGLA
jgi:hypothetical protein